MYSVSVSLVRSPSPGSPDPGSPGPLILPTRTALVKCIYNLIAISTFTCGIHDHLYNQFLS